MNNLFKAVGSAINSVVVVTESIAHVAVKGIDTVEDVVNAANIATKQMQGDMVGDSEAMDSLIRGIKARKLIDDLLAGRTVTKQPVDSQQS